METITTVPIVKKEWFSPPKIEIYNPLEIDDSNIHYPDSDGKPMGETGFHVKAILHLYGALLQYFQKNENIYIAADMFLYYRKGQPRFNKSPDVMVIKGVGNHERRSFKIWEENAVPSVIFEITSKSSMIEDLVNKSTLYLNLGVKEYFVFDPLKEYLENQLVGFKIENNEYVLIPLNKDGMLFSEELQLFVTPEKGVIRLIEPHTGKRLLSYEEALIKAEEERLRADQEAKRAEEEAKRAEQAEKRAEEEAKRADQEAQRAERLAAKLRALGIELDD